MFTSHNHNNHVFHAIKLNARNDREMGRRTDGQMGRWAHDGPPLYHESMNESNVIYPDSCIQ